MNKLDEIRARCDAATPGPWYHFEAVGSVYAKYPYQHGDMNVADIRGWGHLTGIGCCDYPAEKALQIQNGNAAFIANARTDIPYLLDRVEKAEAKLSEMRTPKPAVSLKIDNQVQIGNVQFGSGCTIWKCPCCGTFLTPIHKYCLECGQAVSYAMSEKEKNDG